MNPHRCLAVVMISMSALVACGNGPTRIASVPEPPPAPELSPTIPAPKVVKPSRAAENAKAMPVGEPSKPSQEQKEAEPPPFWLEPDSMTLYSIAGGPESVGHKHKGTFRGHGYLGKVEISKPKQRRAIMEAFKGGMKAKNARMAKCFDPRHAISVSKGDQTVDYVICFECGRVEIYWKGDSLPHQPVRTSPEPKFNRVLKAARVPISSELSPKPFAPKL